jgi:predicted nucleic acid-binding protein
MLNRLQAVFASFQSNEAALTLYSQRLDKEWGLTDCNSFLIMQQQAITEVLAHDEHFAQAGFIALLRDA